MALDKTRYAGKYLTLDINGTITVWRDATFTDTLNTDDATAADSEDDEVVGTTRLLEFSATGFVGSVNNGATLPGRGDAVTTIDASAGADSILPDFTDYTNIKVLSAEYSISSSPATWSISGRSGVLVA